MIRPLIATTDSDSEIEPTEDDLNFFLGAAAERAHFLKSMDLSAYVLWGVGDSRCYMPFRNSPVRDIMRRQSQPPTLK